MKTFGFFFSILILFCSCKMFPGSDSAYSSENNKYNLGLNPRAGAKYFYDITNETEVLLEVEGKEVNNVNRTSVELYYTIDKDSAGNFVFATQYDKIQLYTKNKDKETSLDAARSDFSASSPIL